MASLLRGSAFITGAASGIGKATALSFAKHGIRNLALADINLPLVQKTALELESQFAETGLQVLPLHLDVTDETSINTTVSQTAQAFNNRIDYAVNNAGVGSPTTLSADHSVPEWKRTLDVNLTGVWMCSRALIRVMLAQTLESHSTSNPARASRGVIINVASMYGILGTSLNTPAVAYTASKHGVVGLTRADAIAYADKGIRINAICPGYVATPLLEGGMQSGVLQREIGKIPIGRMAGMDEIADQISVLASPMSSYMLGAAVVVDGGFTIQ